MDDRTHILNPRDYVHHFYNKNKLSIILFYFSNDEIKKKTYIESSYQKIKNFIIGISKIIYINKQVLWVFYICTRLGCVCRYKLCEQAWNKQLIVLIIHRVQSCLRHYDSTLTHQSIEPNKFMKFWQKPQFMLDNNDYNNSEVFLLLQGISRR